MPLYRKILIVVSNNIFKLLLFFTISIIAATLIYTDRNYVVNVLEEKNVYDRVVSSLLETNKDQTLAVGSDLTLENAEVQEVIKNAFPSNDLRNSAQDIINALYDWLENKEANFTFTIDFTDNKQKLAEGLSSFAINRLQSLPVCTESPQQLDPFSATCKPPNIDYEAERLNIEQQILSESGFLDDPIITENEIFSDTNNSATFNENYRQIPVYYSILKASPIYITLVLVSLALVVIFASSTKKIGIRKIGRGLVGAGLSLIFFTVIFSFILPEFTGSLPIFQSNGDGVDSLLNELSITFGQDYAWMIVKLCAPLILIGFAMIFYANIHKNKKDYSSAQLKSGLVNSNEKSKKTIQNKKSKPPIQSSESSNTKPKKSYKNKKYRKIPKKEI